MGASAKKPKPQKTKTKSQGTQELKLIPFLNGKKLRTAKEYPPGSPHLILYKMYLTKVMFYNLFFKSNRISLILYTFNINYSKLRVLEERIDG